MPPDQGWSTWEAVEINQMPLDPSPANYSKKPAIFLDRDGVLIEEVHYLSSIEQIVILPGVLDGLARLRLNGFLLVVTTNQAGIARGMFSEATLKEIHLHLDTLFLESGIRVSQWKYCPHHPTAGIGNYKISCSCRKPKPGMVLEAAKELHIDLKKSYLIGDKISDVQAAKAAEVSPILVRTGYGKEHESLVQDSGISILGVANDFSEAVEMILLDQKN